MPAPPPAGVRSDCESPDVGARPNTGPVGEQQVMLTTERFL